MINTKGFFDGIFKHTIENSIILMDIKGKILDVNKGFLIAFGYTKKELIGKNFEILFTAIDREEDKPGLEIKNTIAKGSQSDNNYLLNKQGIAVWVSGESVSATNEDGEKYLVKIIQNINTQKKLEGYLIENNEFINTVFDAVKDAAFVILNSEMKILRTNKMFLKLFNVKKSEISDEKLFKIDNLFWKNTELKRQITNIIVKREVMKNTPFHFTNVVGKSKELLITSKLMEDEQAGRTILLVIRIQNS